MMAQGGRGAAQALRLNCTEQQELYLLPDNKDSLKMLLDDMSRAGYDRNTLLSNPAGALYMTTHPKKVALATSSNGLFICEYSGS